MNKYFGYLLKAKNETILDQFFLANSYSTTPDQRQDLDSYRDGAGELHRTVLPKVTTTIEITTLPLTLGEKLDFQDAIRSGLIDEAERKTELTYWNDEINDYCTDIFYSPDTKFTIDHCDDETIYYAPATIKFIGYGTSRGGDTNG